MQSVAIERKMDQPVRVVLDIMRYLYTDESPPRGAQGAPRATFATLRKRLLSSRRACVYTYNNVALDERIGNI
jgi:hypothetical protein